MYQYIDTGADRDLVLQDMCDIIMISVTLTTLKYLYIIDRLLSIQ